MTDPYAVFGKSPWAVLKEIQESPDSFSPYVVARWCGKAADEIESLTSVLQRHGFRRCDIPACNCGSWHHVGGLAARWQEIDEATQDYWRNGEILLDRIRRIVSLADDEIANRDRGN